MLACMWVRGNNYSLLVGVQTGAAIWKTLKKLEIDLPHNLTYTTLGHHAS